MGFDILMRGMGMGLAIAAPVGPIGLLCIRRSIAEGRATGLATGLGAAAADATYGLMVAFGLAATGLLVAYARPMQIGGGLLILWLGIGALRSFRAKAGTEAAMASRAPLLHIPVLRAFTSTYLLTLSNPMTILAFIGMVAGLGAAGKGGPLWLVAGVFLGSALWWLILVHVALFAGRRMTPAHMRWLDLVSGSILALWGGWIATTALIG